MFEGFTETTIAVGDVNLRVRQGGRGAPLLLLHGYPQTHVMWHKLAPALARDYTVVLADLRGYGDSDCPAGAPDHANYAKRRMAQDLVGLMAQLGHDRFALAGHDRGGRVAHRLALDYPACVRHLVLLDIVPTYDMFGATSQALATAYYHWFFLCQPSPLPERLIGADPVFYLHHCLKTWSRMPDAFTADALAEYERCFRRPAVIHGTCEDYRAAAGIDLAHDLADRACRIACPLLVLWGAQGFIGRHYDVLAAWRERAVNVRGAGVPGGHFLPEEAPGETLRALSDFLGEPDPGAPV